MENKEKRQFQARLINWFKKNQRKLPWRETNDPYKIWVSEVMLQQTQVVKVIDYYNRFMVRFPDIFTLAKADLNSVLKIWEGMGYYARARNLHRAAKIIVEEKEGSIPKNYEDFLKLPGVGEYIASAVLSQAFGEPLAVVDGNVKRVYSRLFQIGAPIQNTKAQKEMKQIAQDLLFEPDAGNFNQALMELGATICRPRNPLCAQCPVSRFCQSFQNQTQDQFPVIEKKKQVPSYKIVVGVIFKNNKVLIVHRKNSGLLGGLWEFPGGKVNQDESSLNACRREMREKVNLNVEPAKLLTNVRHAYSHFKINIDVIICKFRSGTVKLNGHQDFDWVNLKQLDNYPIHKSNLKFLPLLKKESDKFMK